MKVILKPEQLELLRTSKVLYRDGKEHLKSL